MASTLPVRHRMRNTATISAGQKTDKTPLPLAFSAFDQPPLCLAASVFVSVTATGEALLEVPHRTGRHSLRCICVCHLNSFSCYDPFLAEGEGFELVGLRQSGFQDRRIRPLATPPSLSGTGTARGSRTPNLRFWRPLLYQLSYRRPINPESGAGARFPRAGKASRDYSSMAVTRPEPMVWPPSRIANVGLPPWRRLCNSTAINTLSPASPSRHRSCRRYPAAHGCCR